MDMSDNGHPQRNILLHFVYPPEHSPHSDLENDIIIYSEICEFSEGYFQRVECHKIIDNPVLVKYC